MKESETSERAFALATRYENRLVQAHLVYEHFFSRGVQKNKLLALLDGSYQRHQSEMDRLIRENLTADSLPHFVAMIAKRAVSAIQTAKAHISHAKTNEAKAFIRDCWLRWQNEPALYKSTAAFARDMLDKCDSIKSQAVVERWCRRWKSAVLTVPAA